MGMDSWNELTDDLLLELFSWLPDKRCVGRLRSVCKRWNRLLNSEIFVKVWNKTAITKGLKPCLLLSAHFGVSGLVYDFCDRKWHSRSISGLYCGANIRGSVSGLLLLEVPFCSSVFAVCDPSKGSCMALPPLNSISLVLASTITAPMDGKKGGYAVIAAGRSSRNGRFTVEIYESSKRMWKDTEPSGLPEGVNVSCRNDDLVICKSFVLCTTLKPFTGIFLYDLDSGAGNLVTMPFSVGAETGLQNARLLTMESGNLFLVASLGNSRDNEVSVSDIVIWELDMMSSEKLECKEIGKMPQDVLQMFLSSSSSSSKWFECAGVGQNICFRAHARLQIVSYNVKSCSWNWLAGCDDAYPHHKHMFLKMTAFDTFSPLQLQ